MRGTGVGLWSVAAFEFAPAALLNFAVAFAVAMLLRNGGHAADAAEASVAAGIGAFVPAWWTLRRLGRADSRLPLPAFDQSPLELSEEAEPQLEELLLTEVFGTPPADRPAEHDELLLTEVFITPSEQRSTANDELLLTEVVSPPAERPVAHKELLLDDILESLGPDSRVVRLFDRSAMPTAGEQQKRVDRHLAFEPPRMPPPDASTELHEAIVALRQSLR